MKLANPAFLIGNGINYISDRNNLSWANLLLELFPKKYKNRITNKDNDLCLEGLTYPEIAELALRYLALENFSKKRIDCLLKKEICKKVHEYESRLVSSNKLERHKFIIKYAHENSIPVLTTNYDFLLLKSLKIALSKKKVEYLKTKTEEPHWFSKTTKKYHYPLKAYFRDKELSADCDVKNEFAVWFIHGMKRYSSSLCITNKDYSGIIAELNKLVKDKKNICNKNWEGTNTWLNPFMNNDLVIIGLKLDSEEIDLRWLLVERFLYQQYLKENDNNYKQKETIYVYTKDKELPNGKKMFFETIGIKCVQKEYDEVYKLDYI